MKNTVYNADCLPAMRKMKDNQFDLAIVDPPYGINIGKQSLGLGGGLYRQIKKDYKTGEWDENAPDEKYFIELKRVSKNQIIWGANHFLGWTSSCWIVWDKNNGGSDFADGELAWTSFSSPLRIFKYTWSGFIQDRMCGIKEQRVHPTQKPAGLYKWLLKNYAKEGDTILDTHAGSMSSVIASIEMGYSITAYEIDKDYFEASKKRVMNYFNQENVFRKKTEIKWVK